MSRPGALLLTPGAGSSRDHTSLVTIEAAVAPLPVERMDFPYRKAGRKAPDRAPVLLEAVRVGAGELVERAKIKPNRLVLGGRSMGGRMCSMAVADGLPAAGLVLICYPLHPPGKPEQLRTAHLPDITVPCLFISGDRDAFGTPAELAEAMKLVKGPVTSVTIEGATHDLKKADDRIAAEIKAWLKALK